MPRCPELKNLSRATSFKSINFRQTVPGKPNFLLAPVNHTGQFPTLSLLDPEHPSVTHLRSLRQRFPSFFSKVLCVRAYPKALLENPPIYWPDPPFKHAKYVNWMDRIRETESRKNRDVVTPTPNRRKTVDMAVVNTIGKKIHKSAVIRKKISTKLKVATSLIVTRGADARKVKDSAGRTKKDDKSDEGKWMKLVFNDAEEKNWILQDWVYIYQPTLEVYRLPYPKLVSILRSALGTIWDKGILMEKAWYAQNDSVLKLQPEVRMGGNFSGRRHEINTKQTHHSSSSSDANDDEALSKSQVDPQNHTRTDESTSSKLRARTQPSQPRISRDCDGKPAYEDKHTQSSRYKNGSGATTNEPLCGAQQSQSNRSRLSMILEKYIAKGDSEQPLNRDDASESVLGNESELPSLTCDMALGQGDLCPAPSQQNPHVDVTLSKPAVHIEATTAGTSESSGSISIPLFQNKPILHPPLQKR